MHTAVQEACLDFTLTESMERSSSCAAISLEDVDFEASGELTCSSTTNGSKPKPSHPILARMEEVVIKWQSRKRFFEFTTNL
ncbi:hypothetical protein M407DRAFT_32553 [Tulasnella calospora MUT 4182]|uniref:Uncharacterized protein n=1 Tax=Tulasnella calospora MUT 4182 TaxID=1051891 RepID=A0A0C3Q3S4_9AGAM|nr:hypothetical protein M407DRAFT_32553 [Tulasnella calospora MUT 4182]